MQTEPGIVLSQDQLERAARAVAAALGFSYRGDSLVQAAQTNPRAQHFLTIARAVIDAIQPQDGTPHERLADDHGLPQAALRRDTPKHYKPR